jgi:hypothetical protein
MAAVAVLGGVGGGAAGARGRRRLKEEDEQCKDEDPPSDLDLMVKNSCVEKEKIPGCDACICVLSVHICIYLLLLYTLSSDLKYNTE